ncbi:proline--tRNA ligase [Candidatus Phytoplasma gossypii]|uniref:Proline--tRNA ligase n=1 Tax=Candidatus Phytoplasma gossypii TaxID=2982629 RepID=A0ABT9D0Z2_9MOLU|nr:proline--tRNA ligase ['Gossypium sp.' phytoplasma]MDO8057358.1 proline--tRNA ligase ['Gossypium sp.' phytoplasma]
MKKKLVKTVHFRDIDFSQWYTDLCLKAKLISYSDVPGFFIYLPNGYFLWEMIQKFLNHYLKKSNHQNVYFPLLFSENLFQLEKDHIKGFAPETLIIDKITDQLLPSKLILRPTSEVIFSKYYSNIITSYRDLPKLFNQWCSVVRWEKNTKPFLRSKEFLWQEGHTVHASKKEALTETLYILNLYKKLGKKLLAIPFISGIKTEKEKFKGAVTTYAIETLMYDGQSLQAGTSHYLGTNFSKIFKIQFQDQNSVIQLAHQTSWAVSSRLIGAIIMVHGDDEGLVMPPYIAPIQIVIIPLRLNNSLLLTKVNFYYKQLFKKYRTKLDIQNKNIGWKFSHYELQGIPLRLEIGEQELQNDQITIFIRHSRKKIIINASELLINITELFKNIHQNMFDKALQRMTKHIYIANNYEEFKINLFKKGYVKMSVLANEAEEIIKKETGATARVILKEKLLNKICPVTHKKANQTILFARAY